MRSFLLFRGSRPGLFYDLSAGDSCPLRITSHGSKDLMPLPDIVNYLMLSVVLSLVCHINYQKNPYYGLKE